MICVLVVLYPTNVYLSKSHREYLKSLGNGEFTQGIRNLILWHEGHKENMVLKGNPKKFGAEKRKIYAQL